MNLANQKRIAAEVLKCGVNRVWIDPNRMDEVVDAITRNDIRVLITLGAIKAKQKKGISRGRINYKYMQKKKGKRKGHGSRKGAKYARNPRKERWISTIRPIRQQLRVWRDEGRIDRRTYRRLYLQAKGGVFRSKAHLEAHVRATGELKEAEENV